MKKLANEGIFSNLKYDIPASIIVFLVAVPLCLGIALASGAPLFSGIIAGVVGGIIVGALSGSSLGVSGPAAGLAVIVLSAIQELGAFEVFLLAVVISGIVQLILGFGKAGIIGYFFPSSVIKGMLSGIGIIIIIKQIPHAFGYMDDHGVLDTGEAGLSGVLDAIGHLFGNLSKGAIVITLLSMAVLILWEQSFMKKIKVFQLIQGPLIVVVLGIVLGNIFNGNSDYALLPSQLVTLPILTDSESYLSLLTFPDFSQIFNPQVWVIGFTIALVGSLETLLSLEATDKLDPYKRVSPANQELKAQGLGNVISGLIGGLPITQVIVRSSTNIQSGGRTKMSAILHGVVMVVAALSIPGLLNQIPLASLAAILFVVGYKLAKPVVFKEMYKLGFFHFIPFMVTILGIVFADLLIGIVMGLSIAIFHILYLNYKKPFLFESDKHIKEDCLRLELSEDVTFMHKASIQRTLDKIPSGSKVIIDASKTLYMDNDVMEIIMDFKTNAAYRNISLECIDCTSVKVANQAEKVRVALAGNLLKSDRDS